jgi:hypothetical protein
MEADIRAAVRKELEETTQKELVLAKEREEFLRMEAEERVVVLKKELEESRVATREKKSVELETMTAKADPAILQIPSKGIITPRHTLTY